MLCNVVFTDSIVDSVSRFVWAVGMISSVSKEGEVLCCLPI